MSSPTSHMTSSVMAMYHNDVDHPWTQYMCKNKAPHECDNQWAKTICKHFMLNLVSDFSQF